MISNTSKLQIKNGVLSPESLGKNSPDVIDKLKRIQEQRNNERKSSYLKIPDGLSKNELDLKRQEIDEKVRESYPLKNAIPLKELGRSGVISSEHKDKLAFIFIGDTRDSEENKNFDINSPKISMIVGGGLEASYNYKTGELYKIDPREDYVIGMSAQFHMISSADIDVSGILPISTLKNRSVIKTESDVLELAASETVIIRSLGRPYNSSGTRVMGPGGVHIVSGQNFEDKKIKEPEPMVLGKALSDTMFEIIDKISGINSTLISMNKDILSLKSSIVAHTHPPAVPGVPILPSIDLISSIIPTITSVTLLNLSNGYSNLINLEILKTNKLTPLSQEGFLSQYNRVN